MKINQVSPEQLLALLEALIREAPQFGFKEQLSERQMKWLGRADAALEASASFHALIQFRGARRAIGSYSFNPDNLIVPLHEAYSKIELTAPTILHGGFIPAGDTWNGYAAIIKLIQTECDNLLIVDPYISSSIYTDFAPHSTPNTSIRYLTTHKRDYHNGLVAAAQKWASDPIAQIHPVEGDTLRLTRCTID